MRREGGGRIGLVGGKERWKREKCKEKYANRNVWSGSQLR